MLSKTLIIALAIFAAASAAPKVKASLYYESYCPGCEYFIKTDLVKLHETPDLMAITDLELVPYGNARVISRDPPTFVCQHGDEECYGNFVELCSQEHFPEKWWELILCEETSLDFSDAGVAKCAAEAGVDAQTILTCAKGTEGPALHLIAADKTPEEHYYVPWVVVDGKVMGEEDDFFQMICDAYTGEKPASCTKLSKNEAPKVKVSLYYEVYCPGCEYFIKNDLVQLHETPDLMAITDLELVAYGNARVLTRDPPTFKCQHGDQECYGNMVELCAQEHFPEKWWEFILCQETSLDFTDAGVAKCAAEVGIDAQTVLACAKGTEGPALHLIAADKTPADHKWVPWVVIDGKAMGEEDDFVQMLCDAYTGKKPASCTKKCKREAPKVKISLYYESYCPGCETFITGDLAKLHDTEDMRAITELDLVPYGNAYIVTRDPPTFVCQHGEKECYGNYVELCAQEHFPEKWWEFILCEELTVDFSDEGVASCASKAGIDAQTILTCAKGTEGPALHLIAADKTPDHEFVPWITIDGKFMSPVEDLFERVCDAYTGEKPASCNKAAKNEVPKVKASLYFESYCPGCEDFIRTTLVELHEKEDLMAITDLELVPYGNAHVISRDPPTFQCQHGEKECYGNYVELCSQEHFPEKWWEFILCQEISVDFTDEGVAKCAAEAGIDAQTILTCAKGTEGPALHLIAADKTPDHRWVPWVIVDGKVMGDEDDFFQMICDAYTGEKPASCSKACKNEAPKVKVSLYYESYCPGCEHFITGALVDLHKKEDLMAITDLELVPYGNARVISRDPPTFQCQHGEKECYGNFVELCAQEHFPEKWWEFIVCEERSIDFSDEGVAKCADKAGIDAQTILTCAKGTEGPALHLIAADKTPAEHEYVPWVVVDGKVMGETDDFFQMICDAYTGEKPASCK